MKIFFKLTAIAVFLTSLNADNVLSQIKLNEGFEGSVFPPEGWSVFNNSDVSGEWGQNNLKTNIGTGCAVSNFCSSLSKNYLISKRFKPTTGDSLVFYFRQTFFNVYKDTFNVRISNIDSNVSNMNTILLNLREGYNYPSAVSYSRYAVSLNSYAGQTVWIAFQHINLDGENVRLDDIKVGNPVPSEVGVTDNVFPKGLWGNCTLAKLIPRAVIRNYGTESITTPFNITYKITGPVSYTSVKSDTLYGGISKTIYFDSLNNINIPGTYSVKIYTSLAGDSNPLNDTLNSTFTLNPANYGGGASQNGYYYFANSSSCSSNAPSHPEFCWRDTLNSVNLILNGSLNPAIPFTGNTDNGYFSLGNIFSQGKRIKFYNLEYDSVFITTNGIIGFKRNNILTSNDPAQVYSLMIQPVPALAPLWLDFDFQNAAVSQKRLSYKITQNQLIITFDKAPLKNGGSQDYVSFQISFELVNSSQPNSNIVVQYDENKTGTEFVNKYYSNTLPSHLIGMKNISGTNSLIYRYRDNTTVTTGGPMFSSSLALQIGPASNKLYSKCSDLNLKVLLEAVTPRADTVTIAISDVQFPVSVIESQKILLPSDGNVNVKFSLPDNVSRYYLIISHRNSIKTWSKQDGEVFNSFALSYDFSSNASMAFGNNMKTINSLSYLYSGDVNFDGTLDGSDLSHVENFAENLATGYLASDVNNDGVTDVTDISFVENNLSMGIHTINP